MEENSIRTEAVKSEITIPSWFTWVLALFGGVTTAVVIPSVRAQYQLEAQQAKDIGDIRMELEKLKIRFENTDQLRHRLEVLETRYTQHVLDPDLHENGFSAVNQRLSEIESRLKMVESRP